MFLKSNSIRPRRICEVDAHMVFFLDRIPLSSGADNPIFVLVSIGECHNPSSPKEVLHVRMCHW